jgi:prolyl 4-hydroxylase
MPNVRNYIENDKGLEIFTIPKFLTAKECNYLCKLIEKNHIRSEVAGDGTKKVTYNEGRTSSTSNLPISDDIVKQIDEKIYQELNLSPDKAEPIQGQLYQVGQEFKHHNDFFWGDGFNNFCLSSGQRTWTFMIYLNDVEEGGETEFWHLDQKRFAPVKGTAVVWKNSDDEGNNIETSMHAGLPVLKGKKMVITKWFRQNKYDPISDAKLAEEFYKKQQ